MDKFREIRPYRDHEIRPLLDRLIHDPEFLDSITGFYYPRLVRLAAPLMRALARRKLHRQVQGVHDVATMHDVIAQYMNKIIRETTTGLSSSGLDRLAKDRNYLFVCNHRDIAMDPAFVSYLLYYENIPALQIAIGDNLLKKPFVSDLMRLNKSFIVQRSLKGRKLLKSLSLLSQYIHHCIDNRENVWIAQREGRAKDGIDQTDPALLKMLAMGRRDLELGASLAQLHIVPLAISYEYDACDVLKAEERYQIETTGSFNKTDGSDIEAIVAGVTGFKGQVHVAFGEELDISSDDPEHIAQQIDAQIIGNYRLHAVNFIALELLVKRGLLSPDAVAAVPRHDPDPDARETFLKRLASVKPKLRPCLLFNYANPVLSRYAPDALALNPDTAP